MCREIMRVQGSSQTSKYSLVTWTVTQPKHTDLKATAAPYREALFFNGDIQIPELIFKIGEGRVNITENLL